MPEQPAATGSRKPGPSEDYEALLRGEITSEEYVKRLKATVDVRLARRPRRWPKPPESPHGARR